ncbi:N-glycosylase/DNA lyase [Candidatus Woesearchaeota archaeon]|nr:N-glycosylase/DNA lyase [Candidatus Woesearchaeota archaeon]
MLKEHSKRKKEIKKRLKEFASVKSKDVFYELCFCLLTPQSNAKKCDKAVKLLKEKDFFNKGFNPVGVLKKYTRFHNNKSKYLIDLKKNFSCLKFERDYLVKNVKGLGLKEASHFLRNIGYRNLAILDRHILKNLAELKVIDNVPKSLTAKKYFEIEDKFKSFSKKVKIPMDELDLLFWSMETGEVFK